MREHKPNYYALLEVLPTATEADIRKAWQEQVQVWHPDRFRHSEALHKKAEARTQLINQAYQTLSDPAARARYDAATQPAPAAGAPSAPPARATTTTPPPRPQPAPRRREGPRGPQTPVTIARQGHPIVMVPACRILVDSRQTLPYTFEGFSRIAGTVTQELPEGDYAIAEAPEVFRVLRKRAEEFMTAFSNPSGQRQRFLSELDLLHFYPHRFLVIEGQLPHNKSGGLLGHYQKKAVMDFLDAITARYGIQIIYAESREEAEERVANLAAMHYAYFFAEQRGLSRCLKDDDL